MCHQSVGLIARALEAAGVATVSLSSALSITRSANPARTVFLDYPLGHTAGPPDEPDTQLAIARAALNAVVTATEPGQTFVLPNRWAEPWKEQARALADHRSPRHDTPQYQSEADRVAAISNHGQAAACEVCAPAAVPTH